MREKILQMINDYWKFDNQQHPISNWHDKQDLLKAIEEVFPQENVIKSVCDRCEGKPESDDNILCDDCYIDLHGM